MGVEQSGRISYRKLGAFFGDESGSIEAQSIFKQLRVTEECEKKTISVFEQVISNYRRLSTQRSKLAALGDPYKLFEAISPNAELNASQLL